MDIQAILDFWFGSISAKQPIPSQATRQRWWQKDADFDKRILREFEPAWHAIMYGKCDDWLAFPEGCLAHVLVLDQFSRNMFRGTARMFASDPWALSISHQCLDEGVDQALLPIQRVFMYMPLEHSENMDDQQRCVSLMQTLVSHVVPEQRELFQGFADYARAHLEVIERFGRFPHRNALLNRQSREAEQAYLATPGSGF